MSARENILRRLRQAPAGAAAPLPDVTAWYAARRDDDAAARVARFREQITLARAEVHDTDEASWPDQLCRIAVTKGLRRVLVGDGSPPGAALAAAAAGRIELIAYRRPAAAWRDDIFGTLDAALTSARSGISDTGSLILWPDAREPRLMSLVPPVHFVLLDAAAIHADLHQAMIVERWADAMPTNALVISGPSKTADIQQTLAYGAHGPRELVVLLCHRGRAA